MLLNLLYPETPSQNWSFFLFFINIKCRNQNASTALISPHKHTISLFLLAHQGSYLLKKHQKYGTRVRNLWLPWPELLLLLRDQPHTTLLYSWLSFLNLWHLEIITDVYNLAKISLIYNIILSSRFMLCLRLD